MGGSAGAIGTEANCDFFAEELHKINPDIDVKCISDSGSIYPYHTHTEFCDPHLLEFACFEVWDSIADQSCIEANPFGYNCIRFEILEMILVHTDYYSLKCHQCISLC